MSDAGLATPRSRRLQADLSLLFVAFIWGSAFVAQRLGRAEVGPFAFNATPFAVGGLTLMPVLGRDRLRLPSWDELRSGTLLGESLSEKQLLGCGLMLAGMLLAQVPGSDRDQPDDPADQRNRSTQQDNEERRNKKETQCPSQSECGSRSRST
jgi:drug/metabolite transporter (DMT)-like permease